MCRYDCQPIVVSRQVETRDSPYDMVPSAWTRARLFLLGLGTLKRKLLLAAILVALIDHSVDPPRFNHRDGGVVVRQNNKHQMVTMRFRETRS